MKKFSALGVFLLCLATVSYAAIFLITDSRPKPKVIREKEIAASAVDSKIDKQIDQVIQETFENEIERGIKNGLKVRNFKNIDSDETIVATIKWETSSNGEIKFTINTKRRWLE